MTIAFSFKCMKLNQMEKNGVGMQYRLMVKCLSSGINLNFKKGTKKVIAFSLGNETLSELALSMRLLKCS